MIFPLPIRIILLPVRLPITLLFMIFALCCVLVGEEDFGDRVIDFCMEYGNKKGRC